MKVGRYLDNGRRGTFLVRRDGELADASALEESTYPDRLREAAKLITSAGDSHFCDALPLVDNYLRTYPDALRDARPLSGPIHFEAPTQPRTFICIGLNYRDHAVESKMELPKAPLLFAKTANAINRHQGMVRIPSRSSQLDFEAELAVVIGKRCHCVKQTDALQYVAGYTCGNDLSARDFQFADGQWYRGKSCDGFGPLGPWLVTPSELGNAGNLRIQLRLNELVMQDSSTANLVFDVPALLEHISCEMTLEPGDVILTGTPPGVGFSRKPPVFLKSGDVVDVEIENIGVLTNRIC
jgi:2-keto-4-pentenoate hydratase/2-oxohepta-3-ene-1,7-dioic acid hydratase in catechol pathway